jgi:hypothetical protein
MALAALGAVSAEWTGETDPLVLDMTSSVAAGSTIVIPLGGDSNSISISSATDSKSNTYDFDYRNSGSGMAACLWSTLDTALTTSDTITVQFNATNDCMARAYAFTGIDDAELTSAGVSYTESNTYAITCSPASSGVMFAVFSFPFDYFSASITGWTTLTSIQDGTDQQLLAYYKEVSAGSNTASKTVGSVVAYLAVGMVLPYAAGGTTTTTTPAPSVPRITAQVISLF